MQEPKEFIATLLQHVRMHGASDVHINPTLHRYALTYVVRIRVNGNLHIYQTLPQTQAQTIILYLRTEANMSPDHMHKPYESSLSWAQFNLKARISFIPSHESMAISMRFMSIYQKPPALEDLEVRADVAKTMLQLMQQKKLFLISGATGQGKSTTANALLYAIRTKAGQIITLEDTIEHIIPHAVQISLHNSSEKEKTALIAASLRHDINTFYIGEIKTAETAHRAIEATLSGHSVIATIHARSAKQCVWRLEELGIHKTLQAQTISGILHQTLIPKSCTFCTSTHYIQTGIGQKIQGIKRTFQQHKILCTLCMSNVPIVSNNQKCFTCNYSGNLGQIPIHEIYEPKNLQNQKQYTSLHDLYHKTLQQKINQVTFLKEYSYFKSHA